MPDFFLYFMNNLCKKLSFFTSGRLKIFNRDTGRFSQALNNYCGHYIRKFQILCLRIVSMRALNFDKSVTFYI